MSNGSSENFLTDEQKKQIVAKLVQIASGGDTRAALRAVATLMAMEKANQAAERSVASGK